MYDVRLGHDRRKAGNKSITTERRRNYPLTWKKGGKCARSPNSWVYPISCASSCRPLRMQKSTSSRGENRGSSVYRSKVSLCSLVFFFSRPSCCTFPRIIREHLRSRNSIFTSAFDPGFFSSAHKFELNRIYLAYNSCPNLCSFRSTEK